MESVEDIVGRLKSLDDEYFKKFMDLYPLYLTNEKEGVFGPNELFEMAIKAQTLLSMLGDTALQRMKYIGFDLMYPFDNPVDWYNWKEEIKRSKIPQSIYFSISVRMGSEFNRMTQHVNNDAWSVYCNLGVGEFLVSKYRYLEHFETSSEKEKPLKNQEESHSARVANVSIENFHYNQQTEQKAVDSLDRLQKHSSIWSNTINVATKIFGIKI